jgi:WD40 repeat protein
MSLSASSLSASSLTDRITAMNSSAHVLGLGWQKDTPVILNTDGVIQRGDEVLNTGAEALSAHFRDGHLLIGGFDGEIRLLDETGAIKTVGSAEGKWIDAVALHGDGSLAYAAGRAVTFRDAKGRTKTLPLGSSTQGLAFKGKGLQLAIAQNGGAWLWMPGTEAAPDMLDWKGSHLDITFSPDGRFVVTSMQENQLHGWRMPEKAHMRMSGYPAKTRSMSWSGDGNWLATSGAEAAIIWPFASKEGPMGKPPRECGVRPQKVSCVAFHPKALVVAMGYEDGFIMLCRLTDASEILVRNSTSGGAITALSWHASGGKLLFGAADGAAGYLTLPGA